MSTKVHILWNQPLSSAPRIVQTVVRRWREMLPDGDVNLIDETGLRAHLEQTGIDLATLPIQAQSDILRIKLLHEAGGIWADATVLPVQRPGDWLPALLEPAGFFAFARPYPDRMISSWFLAARPGNPLTQKHYHRVLDYWRTPRRFKRRGKWRDRDFRSWTKRSVQEPLWSVDPKGGAARPYAHYFWFHYLFAQMVHMDPDARSVWEAMPKVSAIPGHLVQDCRKAAPMEEFELLYPALLEKFPVHKLNWRLEWPQSLLNLEWA